MRRQGERAPLSNHATKDDAGAVGRAAAERESAELVIKNLDGTAPAPTTAPGVGPSDGVKHGEQWLLCGALMLVAQRLGAAMGAR